MTPLRLGIDTGVGFGTVFVVPPDVRGREGVLGWLEKKGMRFIFGSDEATQLTRAQVLGQCKMYIAALRIADEFGCSAIGIQYQQGLKDLCPASDLAEGLLNNVDRPPPLARSTPWSSKKTARSVTTLTLLASAPGSPRG